MQGVFDTPHVFVGAPPRYVVVDEDSPDEDFDRLVLATLVEALSHQTPQIFISALAERAIQFLADVRNGNPESTDRPRERISSTYSRH